MKEGSGENRMEAFDSVINSLHLITMKVVFVFAAGPESKH